MLPSCFKPAPAVGGCQYAYAYGFLGALAFNRWSAFSICCRICSLFSCLSNLSKGSMALDVAQSGNGAFSFFNRRGSEHGDERLTRLVFPNATQRNDGDAPVTGVRALLECLTIQTERFCGARHFAGFCYI